MLTHCYLRKVAQLPDDYHSDTDYRNYHSNLVAKETDLDFPGSPELQSKIRRKKNVFQNHP